MWLINLILHCFRFRVGDEPSPHPHGDPILVENMHNKKQADRFECSIGECGMTYSSRREQKSFGVTRKGDM